jgi:flagellar protein FlaI
VLSEFEYELLERLFDDLRDALVLDDQTSSPTAGRSSPEGARTAHEYGLTLDATSIFKLSYYLERNFLAGRASTR